MLCGIRDRESKKVFAFNAVKEDANKFIGKLGLKPCPSRAALYSNLTTNTANLILE